MRPSRFIVDNLATCFKARNFSNSSIEASGDYATEAIRNFWKSDPVAIIPRREWRLLGPIDLVRWGSGWGQMVGCSSLCSVDWAF